MAKTYTASGPSVTRPAGAAYDEAYRAQLRRRWGPRVLALAGLLAELYCLVGPTRLVVAAAAVLCVVARAGALDLYAAWGREPLFEALAPALEKLAREAPAPVAGAPRVPLSAADLEASEPPCKVRVEVRRPGQPAQVVRSDKDLVRIGRMEKADVRLHDPQVARMQAVVEVTDDGLVLIDLGGTVPTRVNGEAITKRTLSVDDVVEIGEFQLRIAGGERAVSSAE